MPLSELHLLKIKTRVKYGVRYFELNMVKLREITNYGKSSISSINSFVLVLTKFSF